MTQKRKSRGFSVIELIVCLVLLGVVYALGCYVYQGFLSRMRLEGAVRCLVSDFQAVRMKAIAQNRSYRIVIRPERSEYVLEKESFSGSDPWTGLVEEGVRRFNDPQNPYYFPGVAIISRSHDPVFLPRGSVFGTTVTLKNVWGQKKIILSSQGRIRIEEGR